jgi:hypothetical protein
VPVIRAFAEVTALLATALSLVSGNWLHSSAASTSEPAGVVLTSLDRGNTIGCNRTCMGLGDGRGLVLQPSTTYSTSVRATYSSDVSRRLALRVAYYVDGATPRCANADPARAITLTVTQDDRVLFHGPMSQFAMRYGAADSLPTLSVHAHGWQRDESHAFAFALHVKQGVNSSDCQARAVFVWTTV